MRMGSAILLIALVFSLAAREARADTAVLHDASDSYETLRYLRAYSDSSAARTIDEIRALPAEAWSPAANNYYIGTDIIWLRLDLRNASSRNDWVIFPMYYLLDFVDIYMEPRGEKSEPAPDQKKVPIQSQRLKDFELNLATGDSIRLYIRVESRISRLINFHIFSAPKYKRRARNEFAFFVAYFAVLTAMLVLNLLLFIFTRSPTPLYYFVYLVLFGLYQASLAGFIRDLFFPDRPDFNLMVNNVFGGLGAMVFALFWKNLGLLHIHAPRCNRILSYTVPGFGLFVLYAIYPGRDPAIEYGFQRVLVLVLAITSVVAVFIARLNKFHPASYSLFGILTLWTSATVFFLMIDGALPAYGPLNYAMPVASLVEFCLFFMALAARMNFLSDQSRTGQEPGQPEKVITEGYRKRFRQANNPRLKNVDVKAKLERIQDLMEQDKLYRDEDLSLQSLAEELSLAPYQLTELLNTHIEKSFFRFINEFRVKEARQLLLEDPKRSVLNIAGDVGFNSKSSFNAEFKKITGQTPTRFRKNADTPAAE